MPDKAEPTAPARLVTVCSRASAAFLMVRVMVSQTVWTVWDMAFHAASQSPRRVALTKSARPRSTAKAVVMAPPMTVTASVTAEEMPAKACVNTGAKVAASQVASGASTVFQRVSTRFITAPSASVSCCHRGLRVPDQRAPNWSMSWVSTGCTVPSQRVCSRSVKFWKASTTPSKKGWP